MVAFLRSPRMKATFVIGAGLLLLNGAVLPLPLAFRVLFCALAGAVAAYGFHGTLWIFEVDDAPPAPFSVRGLPETVGVLGERYGLDVPAARAFNLDLGTYLPVPRLVAGVQFQIAHEYLEEPWPRVRYVIALSLATTRLHRQLRWPLVVTGGAMGLMIGALPWRGGEPGRVQAAAVTMLALFLSALVVKLTWKRARARLARQILLVEEDVAEGLEWLVRV